MTAHKSRRYVAKGTRLGKWIRVMVNLDPADFKVIQTLAKTRGVPVNTVLRDAVWAYVLPIRGRQEAETKDAALVDAG